MKVLAFLAELARSIGRVVALPIDFVGRSVYGIARACTPAAENLCRSALDGASWALAGARNVAVAPFAAMGAGFGLVAEGGGGDSYVAPAPRDWDPVAEASSSWACAAWMWARAAGRGEALPASALQDVPEGVARWLMILSQRECAVIGAGLPPALERHVGALEPEARIAGLRPYDVRVSTDLVTLAKRRSEAMHPVGRPPAQSFDDLSSSSSLRAELIQQSMSELDEREARFMPAPGMH